MRSPPQPLPGPASYDGALGRKIIDLHIWAVLQGLQGAASGVLGNSGGASSGGSSPGGGSSSASTTKKVQNYSHCIQQAGGDVAKMQKCASLLSSGSGG